MINDIRNLIPEKGPKEASALLGYDELWVNFARRIQHHPALFSLLKDKQQHRCPVCKCGLEGALTIHHVSYINRCKYQSTVVYPNPTVKRPNKTVLMPPCEGCTEITKCANFLALVHDGCHVKIHALEKRIAILASARDPL